MKAPTGKLAFAYRTIAALEAERDALRADVERLEASNEHLELHLADAEHQAEIAGRNASGFEDRMGSLQVENGKLRAEVEALREIREIAIQCAENGGYLCSEDLIELRELLKK